MTQITFAGMAMTAKGHAGWGQYGQDVVCAGMSTLFAAVAECMIAMEADGMLEGHADILLQPGNVRLVMQPKARGREKAEAIWEVLTTGCQMLANSYPQNIVMTAAEAAE